MDRESVRFIQEIRYFSAAYEEGNFTRAAAREHCTQSGLSAHIKRLEGILSQRLFDRHARGVTATVAGRCLYASCNEVLHSVKRARQRMLELTGSTGGAINVGVPLTFGRSILASVLEMYISSHPFVDVRMTEGLSDSIAGLVDAGELEAAIVTEPPGSLGLDIRIFFTDRLVLVTGPQAPSQNAKSMTTSAKRRKSSVRLAPAEKPKLVLASRRQGSRRAIESKIRLDTLTSDRILEIDGLEARLELVRTSNWATIVPAFAVANDVKAGRLRACRIPGVDVFLEYFLVQRKGAPMRVACKDFLQLLNRNLERISAKASFEPAVA
jgi:DNA-binding transcriptional LysR family regulator